MEINNFLDGSPCRSMEKCSAGCALCPTDELWQRRSTRSDIRVLLNPKSSSTTITTTTSVPNAQMSPRWCPCHPRQSWRDDLKLKLTFRLIFEIGGSGWSRGYGSHTESLPSHDQPWHAGWSQFIRSRRGHYRIAWTGSYSTEAAVQQGSPTVIERETGQHLLPACDLAFVHHCFLKKSWTWLDCCYRSNAHFNLFPFVLPIVYSIFSNWISSCYLISIRFFSLLVNTL